MVWAYDANRGTLRRKEGDVMKVKRRRNRGRLKRRWLDKVEDDIKEKGLSDGGVCHRTSRPHIKVGIR